MGLTDVPLGRSQDQFRLREISVVSDGAVFRELSGQSKGQAKEFSFEPKRKEIWIFVNARLSGKL